MFRRVLVANRGEIAIRVMRTCREMGLTSVAIFSEPDRGSLHVRYADEAYPIGGRTPQESYLHIEAVLTVARKQRIDAIHPGYGFLSENARFAEACEQAGIAFIGPTALAIRTMGDKIEARKAMTKAGVPVVPGTSAPVGTLDEVRAAASAVGYPIMLKASKGGGGKGMRLIESPEHLEAGFEAARREAEAAFGDGSVYLERAILSPRHIEVQVFADHHGNAVHLNERECSIQRRNQKVIEEAPSPFADASLREALGSVAVQAAQAVQYRGAGTVEFLVDPNKNFYFLEMNTRLQVEHPVTEATTGFDLVAEQLLVAQGGTLSVTSVPPRGHAIEARVYAEDPENGFRPSPGRITRFELDQGPGVRIDAGVVSGDVVSGYYDALLAKVTVHAHTRAEAIRRLDRVLARSLVVGVQSNVDFLRRILADEEFQRGDVSTQWLEPKSLLWARSAKNSEAALIGAACAHLDIATPKASEPAQERSTSRWLSTARHESVKGKGT
jgi:acetyl-CoA carboxylase, biotin carboxylase subunit